LARRVVLEDFTPLELVELLESVQPESFIHLLPSLTTAFQQAHFTCDELEQIAALASGEASTLLKMANPPVDLDKKQVLLEFKDGSERLRQILFYACWGSDLFPDLIHEAWSVDPEFVKRQVKNLPASDVGPFFLFAAAGRKPKILKPESKDPQLNLQPKLLNVLFRSLTASKRRAAIKFFSKEG